MKTIKELMNGRTMDELAEDKEFVDRTDKFKKFMTNPDNNEFIKIAMLAPCFFIREDLFEIIQSRPVGAEMTLPKKTFCHEDVFQFICNEGLERIIYFLDELAEMEEPNPRCLPHHFSLVLKKVIGQAICTGLMAADLARDEEKPTIQ